MPGIIILFYFILILYHIENNTLQKFHEFHDYCYNQVYMMIDCLTEL